MLFYILLALNFYLKLKFECCILDCNITFHDSFINHFNLLSEILLLINS